MSQYEFLMAISSVVVALGLTELARYWGDLLRNREKVEKFSLLQLTWTVILLLTALYYWVGMWAYNDIKFEYFYQIFALVLPTIFLVVACHTSSRAIGNRDQTELTRIYWNDTKVLFFPIAAFSATSLLADLAITGVAVIQLENALLVGVNTILYLVLAFWKNPLFHRITTGYVLVLHVIVLASPLSNIGEAI